MFYICSICGEMRFSRDQLVFKAPSALDELADHADAPIPKTFMLRFTLAWLYNESDGTRWVFDTFWRELTEVPPEGRHEHMDRVCRRQAVHSGLNGICRALGSEHSHDLMRRIAVTRDKLPKSVLEEKRYVIWECDKAAAAQEGKADSPAESGRSTTL